MLEALKAMFGRKAPAAGAKANPVGPLIVGYQGMQEIFPPQTYQTLSTEGFANSATVRAVISRIARVTAELPIKLQRRSRAGDWEDLGANEDDEHPLMQLMRRPNPEQTKVDFFETIFGSRKLAGESFITPIGPSDQMPPTELWWLRPDRMTCVPANDGTVACWKYKTSNGEKIFEMNTGKLVEPVILWKTWDPLNPWRGLSELRSGALQVCQLNEGAAWNARTLKNSMRPPGAFVYAPPNESMSASLTAPQRKQLADDIKTKLTGADSASSPLILDGGLTWQEMSIAPKDLDWLEGLRDAGRTICFLLGYPPLMLGIPGDATYKNYNEARTSFYQDTAIPLMTSLLDVFNETIVPAFGKDLRLVVDIAKIDALADLRAVEWDRVNAATFLTPNEKRAIIGKVRLENALADQLWMPTSLIPIDDASGAQDDEEAEPTDLEDSGEGEDPDEDPDEEETDKPKPKPKPGKSTERQMDKVFNDNLDRLQAVATEYIKMIGSRK